MSGFWGVNFSQLDETWEEIEFLEWNLLFPKQRQIIHY